MRRLIRGLIIGALILGAPGTIWGTAAHAAERLCFPGVPGVTACIEGRFRDYWEQNGGLGVFGYPLAAPAEERTPEGSFLTQYFERQRFESHPENAAPYDVLLGRLGAEIYERTKGDWHASPTSPSRNCIYFQETKRNLCGAFLDYWRTHGLLDPALDDFGRSLALLGLPLTEPRLERNPDGDTVMTQWFERARLEDHGLQGVLLGRLGAELAALPPPPPTSGSPSEAPAAFQELVAAINAERASRGLGALTINAQLSRAAQAHSDDMAGNNFFSHTGSDGSDAGTRIGRTGYQARTWGENIAAGYSTPAEVIAAWMQSPGHRANILNPDFREIGIGYATNANAAYGSYWTNDYAAR